MRDPVDDAAVEGDAVEREVERYEDEAPEQEFAFYDSHASQVGFDGLLLVVEESCGDGKEDDDADPTTALHDELEEDAFRSQGKFQHIVAVMDDEVVHEDHEHRDDTQQLRPLAWSELARRV